MNKSLQIRMVGKDGKPVSMSVFLEMAERVHLCLKEIDRVLMDADEKPASIVVSGLRNGSCIVEVDCPSRPNVTEEFQEVVASLNSPSSRSVGYDKSVVLRVLRMSQYAVGHLEEMSLGTTRITSQFLANVDAINSRISPTQIARGGIVGRLKMIDVHGKWKFVLHSKYSRKPIKCVFSEKLIDEVKDGINKLVSVDGRLHYQKGATVPFKVDVEAVKIISENPSLTLRSLRGSVPDLTGEQTAEEYLDSFRDERCQ